jgi:hypothetical protein
MQRSMIFLLANVALSFYNVGTIWAHQIDTFRSWTLLDVTTFRAVQAAHWKKLPYWVLVPVGLSFIGAVVLVWNHPAGSPAWAIWGNLACQLLSHILTATMWGRWQARLSTDPLGAQSLHPRRDTPYSLDPHWPRHSLWVDSVCMDRGTVVVEVRWCRSSSKSCAPPPPERAPGADAQVSVSGGFRSSAVGPIYPFAGSRAAGWA